MSDIKELLELFLESGGICTDSRKIRQGEIYIALKGEHFDGHDYIEQAVSAGAMAVVSSKELSLSVPLFFVEDTLVALQVLAREYRRTFNCPVIGLTGSNGKTTTKELCISVLSQSMKVSGTKGNFNNHIGVPLTLLSVPRDTEVIIVEMGANHQGEIEDLCEIAEPTIGIITNIGKAHLEGFGGVEGVKKGKSELYRYLAKNEGLIIYDSESNVLNEVLPSKISAIPYSPIIISDSENSIRIHFNGESIHSALSGVYNIKNIQSAISLGEHLGIELKKIVKGVESYIPSNNRSQRTEYNGAKVFLDAYNANPDSMLLSLDNFINSTEGEKIIILGEMLELGDYADQEHKVVLDFLQNSNADNVILTGALFHKHASNYPQFMYIESIPEIKDHVNKIGTKGKHLFIKGSRGSALERIIQ